MSFQDSFCLLNFLAILAVLLPVILKISSEGLCNKRYFSYPIWMQLRWGYFVIAIAGSINWVCIVLIAKGWPWIYILDGKFNEAYKGGLNPEYMLVWIIIFGLIAVWTTTFAAFLVNRARRGYPPPWSG